MENNYWVGIVLGCTLGIILSLIGLFCIIKQNDDSGVVGIEGGRK